ELQLGEGQTGGVFVLLRLSSDYIPDSVSTGSVRYRSGTRGRSGWRVCARSDRRGGKAAVHRSPSDGSHRPRGFHHHLVLSGYRMNANSPSTTTPTGESCSRRSATRRKTRNTVRVGLITKALRSAIRR